MLWEFSLIDPKLMPAVALGMTCTGDLKGIALIPACQGLLDTVCQ